MKQRVGNRILIWAFALSIFAHIAFALFARAPRAEAAPEQAPTSVQIVHIIPPTPAPTPIPKPDRSVAHPNVQAHVAPRIHVAPPRVNEPGPSSTSGPMVVATSGVDTPGDPNAVATAPAASARPACPVPNAPARTISAAMPETPEGIAGLPASAQIQVTLDAAGHVTDLRIYRSAQDPQLDRAAMTAARSSTYAPAIVECLPAGGSYLFTVEFQD